MSNQISGALRERLKRMGRVYSSPGHVVSKSKRPCLGEMDTSSSCLIPGTGMTGVCQQEKQLISPELTVGGHTFCHKPEIEEFADLEGDDSQASTFCEEKVESQNMHFSQTSATMSESESGNSFKCQAITPSNIHEHKEPTTAINNDEKLKRTPCNKLDVADVKVVSVVEKVISSDTKSFDKDMDIVLPFSIAKSHAQKDTETTSSGVSSKIEELPKTMTLPNDCSTDSSPETCNIVIDKSHVQNCDSNSTLEENISESYSTKTTNDKNSRVKECGQVNKASDKNVQDLKKQKTDLLTQLNRKEEVLRKLNMVKMYRAKNDLSELQILIDKWRTVSQEALQELNDIANDPKPTLKELVDYLHLDYKFIGFNVEDESFYMP